MVLFFIRMLCDTTGICLALCFQMISNLDEALFLICMFIIFQQMFRDAVTLLVAAYFVYGI